MVGHQRFRPLPFETCPGHKLAQRAESKSVSSKQRIEGCQQRALHGKLDIPVTAACVKDQEAFSTIKFR